MVLMQVCFKKKKSFIYIITKPMFIKNMSIEPPYITSNASYQLIFQMGTFTQLLFRAASIKYVHLKNTSEEIIPRWMRDQAAAEW